MSSRRDALRLHSFAAPAISLCRVLASMMPSHLSSLSLARLPFPHSRGTTMFAASSLTAHHHFPHDRAWLPQKRPAAQPPGEAPAAALLWLPGRQYSAPPSTIVCKTSREAGLTSHTSVAFALRCRIGACR
ncbi:uncharacterized protein CC84DRAFT_64531 [Paraphaeosphaeria sporulosa]|uniref:Uncharacterized protein n=1 Tax=Paraphaeosphaeria sporulosa TaxID=1460663 RepID=A0A177CZ87_9PLEO|nr:uncharacterized protein CC84DRAFT_64531 [Paraphaeosphaeria sporulosa]OAG11999.1 hypothetical protein CC84DRAFT_64531 [Paraphaeosphaeria sporulosa]